jgi:hypothetical protein
MVEASRAAVRPVVLAAACVLALAGMNRGASGEPASGADQCAERASIVWALVEGHGTGLDDTIARYLDANFALMQAQTDCQNGRHASGVAIYDRLIGEFTFGTRTASAPLARAAHGTGR